MKRRLMLLAALSIAAVGTFGLTQAQANVYCANSATPGTCVSNFTNSATAVQLAVQAAENNPGPDTVRVGTGNFTLQSANGDFQLFSSGANNSVDIVGEGTQSNAILSVQNTDQQTIIFDAGDGSTMSNLSISIPGAGGGTALWVRNSQGGTPPVVNGVNIYKATASNNPVGITGVVLQNGASLVNSSVDVTSTNFTTALSSQGTGSQSVLTSYLAAHRGVHQTGAGGTLTVSRSQIAPTRPGAIGAENENGTLNLNDSWIKMPLPSIGTGVATESSGTGFADTQIDGSTISGGGLTVGTDTQALGSSGSSARLQLDNTVISTGGDNIRRYGENGGNTVIVYANHAAYNTAKVTTFVSNLGTIDYDPQNVIDIGTTNPGFADAGNNDFHLNSTSPLVDAGQPIDPPAGAKDLDGNPRACQGNGSGLIVRDLGAFEYRNGADDCTYPVATIAPASGNIPDPTPTFQLTSDKAGSTFVCSIDDEPYAACPASYTTPALTLGSHSLDVKATDSFGNAAIQHTHAAFTIVAATCATDESLCPPPTCATDESLCPPPPTCATDQSLCPATDKTKPVVKGLKAPRKTKAKKVKVRFRSNEAGSKFKCKLNKGKTKACKSPWKTPRLKKGVNTVTVIAIDKAGNVSKPAKVKIKKRK